MEALQFLKCFIHRDLMFHADPSASLDNDLDENKELLAYGNVPNTQQAQDELQLEDDDDAIMDGQGLLSCNE